MVDIAQAVSEKLKTSGPAVQDRVIEALVEKTLAKRTQQVTDALTEIDKLTGEFRRFKPDVVSYKEDGSILSEGYSKKLFDDRKKNQDRVEKLKKSIDKGLESNDWSDLNKLSGGKDKDNKSNDGGESDS